MSKPTLVQSLLNRPSQTYSTSLPAKKEYYSTRQEMVRIAQDAQGVQAEQQASSSSRAPPKTPAGTANGQPRAQQPMAMASSMTTTTVPRAVNDLVSNSTKISVSPPPRRAHPTANPTVATTPKELPRSGGRTRTSRPPTSAQEEEDWTTGESDLEVYFTPNTSPRTSMVSSVATVTFPSKKKPSRRSLRNDAILPTNGNTYEKPPVAGPSNPANTSKSTPTTSRPTNATPFTAVPSTRTPSNPSNRALHALSTTSSLSSTSLDGHSIFSDYLALGSTESTILTTPYQSEEDTRGRVKAKSKAMANGSSTNSGTPSASPRNHQYSYTDADWAKEVRRPQGDAHISTSTPVKQQRAYAEESSKPRGKTKQGTEPQGKPDVDSNSDSPSSTTTGSGKRTSTQSSKAVTHVVPNQAGMAGVGAAGKLNGDRPSKGKEKAVEKGTERSNESSGTPSHPRKLQSHPPPHTFSAFAPHPSDGNSKQASTSSSKSKVSSIPNGQANANGAGNAYNSHPKPLPTNHRRNASVSKAQPSIMMSMTALLEEDEEGPLTPRMEGLRELEGGWGAAAAAAARPEMRRRRSRSLDSSTSHTRSTQSNSQAGSRSAHSKNTHTRTLTAEVQALNLASGPAQLPSKGTQGYTSLVLPRAPASLNTHGHSNPLSQLSMGANGKIDLTRSGIAQTTMASVEVVRGLGLLRGASGIKGVFGAFGRKRSLSRGPAALPVNGGGQTRASVDDHTASNGGRAMDNQPLGVEGTLLGFTSYRPPPNYVPSRGVLVQVWAVGVDGTDGRLVGVKFGAGGNGKMMEDEEEQEEQQEEAESPEGSEEQQEVQEEELTEVSPPATTTKNPFAALGRSLSFNLKRNNSLNRPTPQRSASSASHKPSATQQPQAQAQAQPPSHVRSPSFSLKRNNTATSFGSARPSLSRASSQKQQSKAKEKSTKPKQSSRAEVGYIPGRSFVGRVLECGWDVSDETVRKGEWVVGLLDIRKCGALAEFIIVDRHRVHRVPHPRKVVSAQDPNAPASPVWIASPKLSQGDNTLSTLTLEELALLPLCGLPAYRAVRTFMFAFSSLRDGMAPVDRRVGYDFNTATSAASGASSGFSKAMMAGHEHDHGHRRRVLVLRGHDGVGAMAVQMLIQRGWRVSVHVPFSSVPAHASQDVGDGFMRVVEERAREWGADEVIFDDGEEGGGVDDGRGAAVRVIESLREDGDVFDAILDTIGGKEVREAGERLLRSPGRHSVPNPPAGGRGSSPVKSKRHGVGQFTTLVGDVPERAIPSAGDNFRAGLRSLRLGSSNDAANAANGHANGSARHAEEDVKGSGKVGYAWVSVAQDVDWEGEDVGETLGTVVRLALEDGIRPLVEETDGGMLGRPRVLPFEKAPYVFVDNGPLGDGGTIVVKIAG